MLRLSPPDQGRLDQAHQLDVHVAGAELNLAVALAGAGIPARWISVLPDGPLGARVLAEVRAAGVDCEFVSVAAGRLGLFFVEHGSPPRPTSVLYDRSNSAFAVAAAELVLDTAALEGARFAAVSGVTPALGPGARALTERFADQAAETGAGLCVDVNHRPRLWSDDDAAATLAPLLGRAEVVVCAEQDARSLFAVPEGEPARMLDDLRVRLAPDAAVVVLTLGGAGAVASGRDGVPQRQPPFPVQVKDRLGVGDAFTAGLLSGLVEGCELSDALARGAALAALKATVSGDLAHFRREEILAVIADPRGSVAR